MTTTASQLQQQHHPLSGIAKTLGADLLEKIQSSNILLVGSGGIGCELLKNLALSGFRQVQVIDLDTIDVSNLNRQFLFRSQHVGQPKCEVACQVVSQSMIPPPLVLNTTNNNNDDTAAAAATAVAQYVAHHGNVCDNTKFHVQFVSQFDVVLNALDNVAARRRVNRLCLAAQVPLVEAGTTGYLGQVNVIDKASRVACYECASKETAKVYPICTIRSTPSMPVHTIVWAKELYKLLFGEKVEDSMLFESEANKANEEDGHQNNHDGKSVKSGVTDGVGTEQGEGFNEPSTYMASIVALRAIIHQEGNSTNGDKTTQVHQLAREALVGLYVDEIQKQLQMGRYKTALKTPAPLNMEWIEQGTRPDTVPPTQTANYKHTNVWSPTECIAEFTNCLVQATTPTNNQDPLFLPAFDKDDALAMRFVTAASNLRNHVFDIQPIQSLYSAKGIAGNIVPAIATTNAICAGLQLLQVFQILRAQLTTGAKAGHVAESCRYINCVRTPFRNGLYLSATPLEPPNPKCFVCRNATLSLSLTTTNWTLQDLLTKVLKQELGFEEPTLMIEGDMIWEEGEESDSAFYTPNLAKLLPNLPSGGIQHGTVIRVEDFSQDLEVDVCFHHVDTWPEKVNDDEATRDNIRGDESHLFIVGGDKPIVAAPAAASANDPTTTTNGGTAAKEDDEDDDDDDVVLFLGDGQEEEGGKPKGRKRSRESDGGADSEQRKKAALDLESGDAEVIELD